MKTYQKWTRNNYYITYVTYILRITALLKRTEVLSKGLALLENCLLRLENNSLFLEYLEFEGFIIILQDLVKVMSQCPFESQKEELENVAAVYW
ncbi:hypothetical protein E2320_014311 [Naja naja]|nr:hypothetical protein E2320_014311 [Naja naja]